jgi:hypothetical protein
MTESLSVDSILVICSDRPLDLIVSSLAIVICNEITPHLTQPLFFSVTVLSWRSDEPNASCSSAHTEQTWRTTKHILRRPPGHITEWQLQHESEQWQQQQRELYDLADCLDFLL